MTRRQSGKVTNGILPTGHPLSGDDGPELEGWRGALRTCEGSSPNGASFRRDIEVLALRLTLSPSDKVEVIQWEGRIELVPVRSAESMRGFLKRLTHTFERETDRCLQ